MAGFNIQCMWVVHLCNSALVISETAQEGYRAATIPAAFLEPVLGAV